MLLSQGKKTDDATLDDVKGAIEAIQKQSDNGQIRKFTGNDYTKGLASGDIWACTAYSGDVVQLKADNPKLEFLIPDEGAIIWTDNMMIPQKPPHVYAAETMINYVYDPVVAAKIAAYVNYVTPVVGAKEELAKSDPDTADNQLIFPSDATLAKLQPYPRPVDRGGARAHRADAAGHRGVARSMSLRLRRRLLPYLLLAPGLTWLGIFFLVPSLNQLNVSLWSGTLETGQSFDWNFDNYTNAHRPVRRAHRALVRLRGDGDRDRVRHRVPARVLHRVPRAPVQAPAAAA